MRRGLAFAVVLSLLPAAPAAADVSLDEFTVTPESTTAGGHPDVTIVQKMSYTTREDDVKDSFVRLAPGLLGNPQNADFCGPEQFAADACPAGSQIGTVTAQVTVYTPIPFTPGVPTTVPGAAYNLPPEGSEPARVGLILRPPVGAKVFLESAAVLRLGPDGYGLETNFADQPRSTIPVLGQVQIDEVSLTFSGQGTKGGFMRMPTACREAVSVGRASSYDSAAVSEKTSAFTPTDCGALAFNPRGLGSVGAPGLTSRSDNPPITSTLRFNPEEAALKSATVTIPPLFAANQAVIGIRCPAAQAATGACPASSRVGTATIDSPLQPRPVSGPIFVAENSANPLPGLIVMLPPPVGVRLDATVEVGSFGTRNTFASTPDLPVRSFTLQFDGGPNGVLKLTDDLCDEKRDITFDVDLLSHSGKRSQFKTQVATPGCDPRATGAIRRRGTRAKLVSRLTAAREGPGVVAASLRLPKALRTGKRRPLVYVGTRRLRPDSSRRTLSVRFPSEVRGAVIVWRGLRASRRLKTFTHLRIAITDTRGKTTHLRTEVPVRGKAPRRRR